MGPTVSFVFCVTVFAALRSFGFDHGATGLDIMFARWTLVGLALGTLALSARPLPRRLSAALVVMLLLALWIGWSAGIIETLHGHDIGAIGAALSLFMVALLTALCMFGTLALAWMADRRERSA